MSDLPEEIDQFFKQNIDKVDVKYNPAHWEKLQQTLSAQPAITESTGSVYRKVVFKRIFFAVIFIGVVTAICYYLFSTPESGKQIEQQVKMDSLKESAVKELTGKAEQQTIPAKDGLNTSSVKTETGIEKESGSKLNNKNNSASPLLEKTDATQFQTFKKDSISVISKDTLLKKKRLGVFW